MKIEHEIGKWIVHLVSLNSVKYIVEIGSFNGRGSSFLICRSVIRSSSKRDKVVMGLECDLTRYKEAKNFLKYFGFYNLEYGTLVSVSDLDVANLEGDEPTWLQQDIENLENCPDVGSSIPKEIDLLLLDGGEFSSLAEFRTVYERCRAYIVLDDIYVRKIDRYLTCSFVLRIFNF